MTSSHKRKQSKKAKKMDDNVQTETDCNHPEKNMDMSYFVGMAFMSGMIYLIAPIVYQDMTI